MRETFRKITILLAACLLMSCWLTGCRPSKKKVLSSSYYKELNKKYKKLKKEKEELEEELKKKDEPSEDEQRASDYLEKIARDTIISVEVGYADNMEGSELIKNEAILDIATAIAKRADLTEKYTPEQVEKKYGPGYEYILYDEDNAVYEIMVYGGNYIVFTDLPSNVYYAYNASALGDAFLHYKDGYPNSKLLHRLADSPLVTDDDNCYENDSAFRAANYIRKMDKTHSSRKEADKVWLKEYQQKNRKKQDSGEADSQADDEAAREGEEETSDDSPDPSAYEPKGTSYTFYHHGNTLGLTLYKEFICIENMDEKRTWYQADPDDIKELKKMFVVPAEETADSKKETQESKADEDQSHAREIEEESDVSQKNE